MATRVTRQQELVVSENEGGSRVTRQQGLIVSETVGETRVTRQQGLVVSEAEGATRATRAALLVVSEVSPAVRVTRQGYLVVSRTVGEGSQPPLLPSVAPNAIPINWVRQVELDSVWQTDVTTAYRTLAEERVGLRDRPRRRLTVQFTAMSRDEGNQVLMNLIRLSNEQVPVPLFCDQSQLTAAYSSGTTINLETRWRRFVAGAQVIVIALDGTQAYGIIDSLTDTEITLQADLSSSFAAGALVFPVIGCEASLRSDARFVNDSNLTARIRFQELDGKNALKLPDYDPSADFTYHEGHPVFDTPIQWRRGVTTSASRAGSRYSTGRTQLTDLQGDGPQLSHQIDFLQCTREEAWPVIRFNDWARGRKRPFWLIAPEARFILVDLAVTHADVEPSGNIDDVIEFIQYVALVLKNSSWQIRAIDSVTVVGDVWRITFDSVITLPGNLSEVDRLSSAHFVRNVSDEFRERWRTDGVVEMQMRMIDLPNEKDSPITDLIEDITPTGIQDIPDLRMYCDVCRNAFDENDNPALPYPADQVNNGECKTWGDVRNESPADSPALRQDVQSRRANLTLFNDPTINNGKPSMGSTTVDPSGPTTNLLTSPNSFTVGQPNDPAGSWNILANAFASVKPVIQPLITAGSIPGVGVAGTIMGWRTTFAPNNAQNFYQEVPHSKLTTGSIYTGSLYCKYQASAPGMTDPQPQESFAIELLNNNTGQAVRVDIDLTDGSTVLDDSTPANVFSASGSEAVGGGWYRIWVTMEYNDPVPLNDAGFRFGVLTGGISPSASPQHPGNGDITNGHALSSVGACQLEEGIDPAAFNSPDLQDDSQWTLQYDDGFSEPLTPASDDGLTVVINAHLPSQEFTAIWATLADGSNNTVLYWDNDEIRLHDAAGNEIAGLTLSNFDMLQSDLVTMVYRWEPGVGAKLYFNGVQEDSATDSATDIGNGDLSQAFSRMFQIPGLNVPGTDDILDLYPFYNGFAIYSRALTVDEVNQIGEHYKTVYGGSWTPILGF